MGAKPRRGVMRHRLKGWRRIQRSTVFPCASGVGGRVLPAAVNAVHASRMAMVFISVCSLSGGEIRRADDTRFFPGVNPQGNFFSKSFARRG